ncbi:MAG: molybdopterin-dependent oxidoreductase, partial [Anaerolineales bacterium]|nr:molybdopterin-dependent oxidoreductase [Anaerolineales bacterium]
MSQAATPQFKDRKGCWRLSRRSFLIGAATAGTGLFLGWRFGVPALRLQMAAMFDSAESGSTGFGEVDTRPNAWFAITPDNRATIHIPKIEMGQGIHTALAQIAADELEVDWALLTVALANTADGPNDGSGTTGSMSVTSLWTPLREVAATMRQMLVNAAAEQLGVPAGQLTAHNSTVFVQSEPDRVLTYGEIVAARTAAWEVPEEAPPLKTPDQYRYIGQALPRVDFQEKLTGRARYGFDMRLDGMLYGAAAYPNTVAGRITAASPGSAAAEPGVVTVLAEADFAGVAAESRVLAEAALGKLAIEYEDGPLLNMADIQQTVTVGNGKATIIQREGDANGALAQDTFAQTHLAEYRTPLAAHAHLEPQAALVDVRADQVEAWVSTQMPELVRETLAEALGRELEEIKVYSTYIGGGFGRKAGMEVAVEAARLSRAAGRPVHVGWNRAKEFRAGYLRPPTHHILKAGLSADGRIQALDHQQASADVAYLFLPAFFPILAGADFGATRGARLTYDIPNLRTVAWRTELPFPTGWWRGLGLLANIFAIESFVDELAELAGADPLAFRLAHLPESTMGQRLRGVLERVAEMA